MTPRDLFLVEFPGLAELELEGAYFEPHILDGALVGSALVWGTEVHYVAAPEWRQGRLSKRRIIREFLAVLLAKSPLGFLTTRAHATNTTARDFVERVGFKPTWSDGDINFYMLGSLPFSKRIHP